MSKAQARLTLLKDLSSHFDIQLERLTVEIQRVNDLFTLESEKDLKQVLKWALEDAQLAVDQETKKQTDRQDPPSTPRRNNFTFSPFTTPSTPTPRSWSVPSPASSSPPTPVPARMTAPFPPRSMASLGSLPPELKLLIVEKVTEIQREIMEAQELPEKGAGLDTDDEDEDEEDSTMVTSKAERKSAAEPAEDEFKDPDKERYKDSPLWSLALVNREFAVLSEQHIWESLDFGNTATNELVYFVHTLLPRYRHHIKAIDILHTPPDEDSTHGEFSESILAIRQGLLSLICLLLPNLESVDVDFIDNPIRPADLDPSITTWLYQRPLVFEALRIDGAKLINLSLDASSASVSEPVVSAGFVAEVIQYFPNLGRLRMEGFGLLAPEGTDSLQTTIVSLPRLETLFLDSSTFVTDEFIQLNWKSSLKVIALSSCTKLSLTGFVALVKAHSATLEALDLDEVPLEVNELEKKKVWGKPFPFALPKLDTLVLSTFLDKRYLALFTHCALKDLTIGYCPGIEYLAWENFVTLQEKTLKRVVVDSDPGDWTEGQREGFEVFCYAKKIDCIMEDEDSESEGEYTDEDEEAMDDYGWSDEDEEGPEFLDSGDEQGWGDDDGHDHEDD